LGLGGWLNPDYNNIEISKKCRLCLVGLANKAHSLFEAMNKDNPLEVMDTCGI